MQKADWLQQYLDKVAGTSDEGREAVNYIRSRKTRVGFKKVRESVGAFWTVFGNIRLNSVHHTYESTLTNPRAWTLLIHEVRHLQQGMLTALSVYGELDAWQREFRVYQKITGRQLHATLVEILALPLSWDRGKLRRARELMQVFAGKGYRVDLLPLYPLHKEITYQITRMQPAESSVQ
jgi:hypothetical protein